MDQGREKRDTWPQILRYNYENYGDGRRAMRYKHYGIWQPYTWKDYYLDVKSLSLGLLSLGFKPGDKLLIIGDNAPQWYCAELAAQAAHGVSVGAYSELTPQEIEYLARDSESVFAVAEGQEQLDKLLQIKGELPLLRKIIFWSYKGLGHYEDSFLMGYRQVLHLGEEYEKEHPGLFERNVVEGKADDVCALVYTSGTDRLAPKAAVHTFRTLRAGAESYLRLDPWNENDNVVPYLPPAWITEQWLCVGCHLISASTLNFAEAPETQQRDTSETSPSIVFYGARQWENQAAAIQARILRANFLNRYAFRALMPVGLKRADLKLRGKKPGLLSNMLFGLADMIMFKSIRSSLGLKNARICYTTGAVLSPDAFKFYHALNLPLKNLYWSTEGGALAGARGGSIPFESIGPVCEGAQAKTTDQGELIYRQPGTFLGYYRDPEGTAEVLKDGWFHSGDCGRINENGEIVFLDRLKDMVQLACGENLAPQSIESRLRFSPYIKDAWVVAGPGREYAAAVVIINYDNVSRWAGKRRLAFNGFVDLSQSPEVYGLVKTEIERVNQALRPGCRIRKFVNLHKELDPEEGELTRNRKLRRDFLGERYRRLLEAVYAGESTVPIEIHIQHRDGRTGTESTTIAIQSIGGAA